MFIKNRNFADRIQIDRKDSNIYVDSEYVMLVSVEIENFEEMSKYRKNDAFANWWIFGIWYKEVK